MPPKANGPTEPKKKVEVEEAKDAKFRRLGTARFVRAAEKLRMLKHLANKSAYDFTEDQVDQLIGTLQAEVDAISNAFHAALHGKGKDRPTISL